MSCPGQTLSVCQISAQKQCEQILCLNYLSELTRRRTSGCLQGASAFDKQVHLQVSDVSDSAKAAIERCGGSVKTVYYNKLGLRALFMPDWFERKGRLLPRPARPPPKKWDKYDSIGSLPPDRSTPTEKTVTA